MRFMNRRRFAAFWIGALFSTVGAQAQGTFPNAAVKLVIPFPAGGTTDILGRTFAQKLSDIWKQPVIVENRAGAGGTIGSAFVSRAPADGYTLVLGSISNHGIGTSLVKNLPYRPERDFSPITLLATLPNVLVVNPEVPAKNLSELIAYAKKNPGKLSYASAGQGTSSHIVGEYFKSIADIDVVHVPYKGSAPALSDLMGGHIAYAFDYMPSVMSFITSGKLRALATTGPTRSRATPNIPTAIEQGLAGFNVLTWYAVYAPAGTPKAILQQIRDTFAKAAADPDVQKHMDAAGVDLVISTPDELASFQDAEFKRWSQFIAQARITVE